MYESFLRIFLVDSKNFRTFALRKQKIIYSQLKFNRRLDYERND